MIFHGKNRVLFNTRWMAFAGFCVAAGFAAHKCYVIAMHQSPKARWIHDADEILPPWTRMALFALVLAVLILNVGQVLLQSGGFERVYVAVFPKSCSTRSGISCRIRLRFCFTLFRDWPT